MERSWMESVEMERGYVDSALCCKSKGGKTCKTLAVDCFRNFTEPPSLWHWQGGVNGSAMGMSDCQVDSQAKTQQPPMFFSYATLVLHFTPVSELLGWS